MKNVLSTVQFLLQWGRRLMATEICDTGAGPGASDAVLQWGRRLMATEIETGFRARPGATIGFNGAVV